MSDDSVDKVVAMMARGDSLAKKFGSLLQKNRLSAGITAYACACGEITLQLDLSQTPQSKPFLVRLGKKFAKRNKIHFSTDLDRCAACQKTKNVRAENTSTIGKEGVTQGEITIKGLPV